MEENKILKFKVERIMSDFKHDLTLEIESGIPAPVNIMLSYLEQFMGLIEAEQEKAFDKGLETASQ